MQDIDKIKTCTWSNKKGTYFGADSRDPVECPPEVLEEWPARDLGAVELLGAGAEPRVVGAALALNMVQSGDISSVGGFYTNWYKYKVQNINNIKY